ncbi:MAG: CmpA/NrtA family ABC transporter substrate-binding protein [Steroidobacteraceae bacterium]
MNVDGQVVRVGFMPLLDCALLVVAHEVGLARQAGLTLRLIRESSWANIRDRLAIGHFDAAHMLAPMVVAECVGAGQLATPLIAPVALGTGANAITVSRPLWQGMQRFGAGIGFGPAAQAQALAKVVAERAVAGMAPLTLAMVFPFSCHNYQLRDWLESAGVDPEKDVRLVVLPPPLLVDALRSGQIDGFCVGEPWNSLAVDAGIGVIAAVCSDVWERPPEKILAMRASYAEENPETVVALVQAIAAASRWAADPVNRQDLAQLLSQPRYVGAPARILFAALNGSITVDLDRQPIQRSDFVSFGPDSIAPHTRYAELFYSRMRRWGQVGADSAGPERARAGFRMDIFRRAVKGVGQ